MERTPQKEDMRKRLIEPLPPEAISPHPTKSFLSSIKAIYVTERLNDVFGFGAWTTKVEYVTDAPSKPRKDGTIPTMVVVKLTLEVPSEGIYYEAYGGNDNEDLGDAYKGAMTDALTKIGSFLGIGIDVFKGKQTDKPQTVSEKVASKLPNIDLVDSALNGEVICVDCGTEAKVSKTGNIYCPQKYKDKTRPHDKFISKQEMELKLPQGDAPF